jgi:hypothetical protein
VANRTPGRTRLTAHAVQHANSRRYPVRARIGKPIAIPVVDRYGHTPTETAAHFGTVLAFVKAMASITEPTSWHTM